MKKAIKENPQKSLWPNGMVAVIQWQGQPPQIFIEKPPHKAKGRLRLLK